MVPGSYGGPPPPPRRDMGGLALLYIYACLGSPASQLGTALRGLMSSLKAFFKGPARASEPTIKVPL